MRIATVIPLAPITFKEELSYFSALPVGVNDVVEIEIKKRKMLGLVTAVREAKENKLEIKNADYNLRKIDKIKNRSILKEEFIASAFALAEYTVGNKNAVLAYLIPEIIKEKYDLIEKEIFNLKNTENLSLEAKNVKAEKLLFQANTEDRISYYKTLIRESFAIKKSVFIVLPRENDIEFFTTELSRGIENFVFPLFGGMHKKKLEGNVHGIINTEHAVLILGTAQYLSIPRNDIATIILEKESSSAYKTIAMPHIDLRNFVEIYAQKTKTKLIISDTILRFETLGRKEISGFGEVRSLSYRIITPTEIKVVGKNSPGIQNKKWQVMNDENINKIKKVLEKNQNVFVFALRKGLATYTICKHCETPVYCHECEAPLVLYTSADKKKRMFVCNKCKSEKDPATVCEYCGSWNLIPLGVGTDLVYATLNKIFPENKILQLDKESTNTKTKAEKVIKEFEKSKGSILVGTEMALYYIEKQLPLVVLVSFDSLWSIPNYKISEKIIALILHTLEKTNGLLSIETRNENDSAVVSIQNGNLLNYVKNELEDRKNLGYPPYKRFIKISWQNTTEAKSSKKYLEAILEKYDATFFGNNALLRIEPKDWSLPELTENSHLKTELASTLRAIPQNQFKIQIDPEDVL